MQRLAANDMPVHKLHRPHVMQDPPASRAEIAALIGDDDRSADASFIDRIRNTGASVDEIGEAIDELEGQFPEAVHVPSSTRVAAVRALLAERIPDAASSGDPNTVSILGEPIASRGSTAADVAPHPN